MAGRKAARRDVDGGELGGGLGVAGPGEAADARVVRVAVGDEDDAIERARQEREQLLGELETAKAAISQAEAVGAEARERAAVLAGKLESEQSHSAALAALLARLNLVAGSEGEGGEPSA